MPVPHYLRFARALALCSSLAVVPGCPSSSEAPAAGDEDDAPGTDAPSSVDAPALVDAPSLTDAPSTTDAPSMTDAALADAALADAALYDAGSDDAAVAMEDGGDCTACECFLATDAGLPSCEAVGLISCCVAVGPLAPPDLPA